MPRATFLLVLKLVRQNLGSGTIPTPIGRLIDVETPKTLRDLVIAAVDRHQTSVRQLGFMAQDRGFKVTSTTLGHIKAGTYRSTPSRDTLAAIAWLAGVHEDEAFVAAGLPVPGPPLGDELPPGADNLSPRARGVLIELARYLIEMETKGRDGNVSTAPITRAGESPAATNDDVTQDDFGMATYDTGRESQGRRLRRLQDEAAEASQE